MTGSVLPFKMLVCMACYNLNQYHVFQQIVVSAGFDSTNWMTAHFIDALERDYENAKDDSDLHLYPLISLLFEYLVSLSSSKVEQLEIYLTSNLVSGFSILIDFFLRLVSVLQMIWITRRSYFSCERLCPGQPAQRFLVQHYHFVIQALSLNQWESSILARLPHYGTMMTSH